MPKTRHIFRSLLILLLLVLSSGCTNPFSKSNGNAEGYSGFKVVPGTYYSVDTRAACPNANVASYRSVVEVAADRSVSYQPACGGAKVVLPASSIQVSPLGIGATSEMAPMLSHQMEIFDKIERPTLATGPSLMSTHTWCVGTKSNIRYDIVLRADGRAENPTNVKASVIKTPLTGRSEFLGGFDVFAAMSPGMSRYTAAGFSLNVQNGVSGIEGELETSVQSTPLSLSKLTCRDTFQNPPAPSLSIPHLPLSAGSSFSCAVKAGRPYCWGLGSSGQTGLGHPNNTNTPTPLDWNATSVGAISAGGEHGCATLGNDVLCWGNNNDTQLGNPMGGNELSPIRVQFAASSVTGIATGEKHSCAIFSKRAYCWGNNSQIQLGTEEMYVGTPVPVANIPGDVHHIATGANHSCALNSANEAYCWGANNHGQLGMGNVTSMEVPTKVSGLKFTTLSAGGDFTCGITSAGRVACWGDNRAAQVTGDGVVAGDVGLPLTVSGLSGPVTTIELGGSHACAVQSAKLYCWGGNDAGQLGLGTQSPTAALTALSGLDNAIQSSGGLNHSLALTLSGVYGWGANGFGQAGGSGANVLSPRLISF